MKIREVIVVEGKNDTNTLKSYFQCDTIETHGSAIGEDVIALIKKAKATRGVIIFTDPDAPGEKIRCTINQQVNGCKNAFIPKEVAKTEKKVGIEHASKEEIEKALSGCMTYDKDVNQVITLQDLVDLKLTGFPESQTLRSQAGKKLQIGHCNAKTFCARCNMLKITREELERVVVYEKANC